MTENEAIKELETSIDLAKMCTQNYERKNEIQGYEMAIKALEEVQQYRKHGVTVESALNNMCDLAAAENLIEEYRAIGTPEELQDMKNNYLEALSDWRQYRKIGTLEECRAAMEKQNVNKELESHDEKHILECCISLMQEVVNEFAEWYRWQHGEDAIEELDEEERFCFRKSYFSIVQELFLIGTNHSGGTSTRAKCEQLGVDSSEEIEFDWSDEE